MSLSPLRRRYTHTRWLSALLVLTLTLMVALTGQSVHAASQPGGDIPDTAVYLRYQGRGFSVDYVEGWLQTTSAHGVMFSDKDSSVVLDLRPRVSGKPATYVRQVDLPRLARTPALCAARCADDDCRLSHGALDLSQPLSPRRCDRKNSGCAG